VTRLPSWENKDAVFEWIMTGEDWLNPSTDEISPLSERIEDAVRDAVEVARYRSPICCGMITHSTNWNPPYDHGLPPRPIVSSPIRPGGNDTDQR
jgi:hypothetical protein